MKVILHNTKVRSIEILNSTFFIRQSSFLCFPGQVAAKGFFGEVIARGFVGPRATTAAHPFKLAGIALPFKFIIIA
jgi:hypothetical protein